MSLRRRPTVTRALLAANRANARKSTGPRTVEGKNRVVLNALKEGRHARNFAESLRRAKSQGDAELFQWILDQVRAAFRLHGWQEDEREAERLAQRVWCELEREERRLHAFARRLGNGRVRFPRRTTTLWALPWTPRRLGGVGTNPEYAVKSIDKFLTSLSRIQIEIRDERKVPVLKFWVRRSPLRPLPRWATATLGGFTQAWLAARYEARGNAEKRGDVGASASLYGAAAARGWEQTRNVSPNQLGRSLTSLLRISDRPRINTDSRGSKQSRGSAEFPDFGNFPYPVGTGLRPFIGGRTAEFRRRNSALPGAQRRRGLSEPRDRIESESINEVLDK